MNPFAKHAEPESPVQDEGEPLDLTSALMSSEPSFDQEQWAESRAEERGAGGRQVLGILFALLAAAGWRSARGARAGRWADSRCRPRICAVDCGRRRAARALSASSG